MVRSNKVVNPLAVLSALSDIERRSQQASPDYKRQYVRKSVRGEAVLQSLEDASFETSSLRVQLRDVSLAGVGFLSNEPVETGSLWRVLFVSRNHVVGQQNIIVRHCREITGGAFLVGSQFAMDPGLLQTLGISLESLRGSDDDLFEDSGNILPSEE